MSSKRAPLFVVPLVALGLVAGCGGDAAQTGENVIETRLEEQIGLGELDASCDQPDDAEVGTEFACTATTEDGRVVEFLGAFTDETTIFVQPLNVIPEEGLEAWKVESARVLSLELPIELDPDLFDCPGEGTVFLDTDPELREASIDCTYPNPDTGEPVPLRITVMDFVIEEGYQNLFAAIGDAVE